MIIKSYFKIALRYLAKNKLYSFINMAGLSMSLACAMLMILYTKDELSFDQFHKNVTSLYQIVIDIRNPDGSSEPKMGVTGSPHGPRFKANIPEVESYTRTQPTYWDIKLGDDVQSQIVMLADSNFFDLFSFPLLHGNPKTCLQQPNSIVVSQDMAIKYFRTEDALNKTILVQKSGAFMPYTVTGVAKQCPQNSSIQFSMLVPLVISVKEEQTSGNWVNCQFATFVKLSRGSDLKVVESKMQQLFEIESKEAMDEVRSAGFTQSFHHLLYPIAAIHLTGQDFVNEAGLVNGSNPMYSYILSGIALFILAIACINFINLTIARSVKRAKEIGIRKVVGGGRRQLIGQFLGESFLFCCLSFLGAMLLAQLLLPLFNNIVNKELSLSYLMDAKLISSYLMLLVVTGLLAGFYPAIVLSSFSPVETLYNQFRLSGKNYLQKGLVVFQFALATIMIMATLTIYLQFDYLTTKDLGYSADHVVQVAKRNLTLQEAKSFTEELLKNPSIVSVAPHAHSRQTAKINTDSIRNFPYEIVDENFIDLLRLQIIQGRNFSSSFPSDSSKAVLVNQAFVKMAGWKNPIGELVEMIPFGSGKKMVVGVVKDYHYSSLKNSIEPQLFVAAPTKDDPYKQVLVRIMPNSEASCLPYIEKTFKKLFPLTPYSYQFSDEINQKNYEAESKWKKVILLGALLTVFIASIGLFGLSILIAEKRFKEIGIRKVLGASVRVIVFTLSRDFVILISMAMFVALPFAYYAGRSWLDTYPYRTTIGPEMFIVGGVLVLLIALATISYQSIKAALINPVEALKRD
jgi:putative ABC transport system permease protein